MCLINWFYIVAQILLTELSKLFQEEAVVWSVTALIASMESCRNIWQVMQ